MNNNRILNVIVIDQRKRIQSQSDLFVPHGFLDVRVHGAQERVAGAEVPALLEVILMMERCLL